jgi:hypothetical protein
LVFSKLLDWESYFWFREFEETERLTALLSLAEQEIAGLKTNLKNMEIVLGKFYLLPIIQV